jgi:hypothetical protein
MKKTIPLLGCACFLALAACGEQIALTDRPCPCQTTGWSCCPGSNICTPEGTSCLPTYCPKGITLPNQPILASFVPNFVPNGAAEDAGSSDAGTFPVLAYGKEFLEDAGTTVSFSYKATAWPQYGDGGSGGIGLTGWYFEAKKHQSFTFRSSAVSLTDGGQKDIPLAVSVYGPIVGIATGSPCDAPLVGTLRQGDPPWVAEAEGTYFVAPYHELFMVNNDAGVSVGIQGLYTWTYTTAYFTMSAVTETEP